MRKIAKILFILMAAVTLARPAYADDAFIKLGRGLENIITSPVEFATQYSIVGQHGNPIVTVVAGTFYGIGMTVVRILGGAYEVVTFPIPLPAKYAPLMDPETPLKAYQQLK